MRESFFFQKNPQKIDYAKNPQPSAGTVSSLCAALTFPPISFRSHRAKKVPPKRSTKISLSLPPAISSRSGRILPQRHGKKKNKKKIWNSPSPKPFRLSDYVSVAAGLKKKKERKNQFKRHKKFSKKMQKAKLESKKRKRKKSKKSVSSRFLCLPFCHSELPHATRVCDFKDFYGCSGCLEYVHFFSLAHCTHALTIVFCNHSRGSLADVSDLRPSQALLYSMVLWLSQVRHRQLLAYFSDMVTIYWPQTWPLYSKYSWTDTSLIWRKIFKSGS